MAGWLVPNIGLDDRPGVDAPRECFALESKTAISSSRRPGTGRVRSTTGSVEEREWNEVVPPPRKMDRRPFSGVARGRETLENAVDEGRDSSVLCDTTQAGIRVKRTIQW